MLLQPVAKIQLLTSLMMKLMQQDAARREQVRAVSGKMIPVLAVLPNVQRTKVIEANINDNQFVNEQPREVATEAVPPTARFQNALTELAGSNESITNDAVYSAFRQILSMPAKRWGMSTMPLGDFAKSMAERALMLASEALFLDTEGDSIVKVQKKLETCKRNLEKKKNECKKLTSSLTVAQTKLGEASRALEKHKAELDESQKRTKELEVDNS